MSLHVAVDLGGTTARVAGYMELLSTEQVGYQEFEVEKADKEAASAGDLARAFYRDYRTLVSAIELVEPKPASISLAVAGKVDPLRSRLVGAGNLIHWVGEPVFSHLRDQFECDVVLGNDAEAAALAATKP